MRRNKESKYRQKIICECNLNKQLQKKLDELIKEYNNISYKNFIYS